MDSNTLKTVFEEQGNRMRESIREEMETWARALQKKYGIVQEKKKKSND